MRGDWKLEPITPIVRYIDRKAYFTAFQSFCNNQQACKILTSFYANDGCLRVLNLTSGIIQCKIRLF